MNEIEKEFDKFAEDEYNHDSCYECEGEISPEKIKSFYRQAIIDLLKRVMPKERKYKEYIDKVMLEEVDGFNNCRQQLINNLEKEGIKMKCIECKNEMKKRVKLGQFSLPKEDDLSKVVTNPEEWVKKYV